MIESCPTGANSCLTWTYDTNCVETTDQCVKVSDGAACLVDCNLAADCDSEGATQCDGAQIQFCEVAANGCLALTYESERVAPMSPTVWPVVGLGGKAASTGVSFACGVSEQDADPSTVNT